MLKVGLTGGIGCGKTTVSNLFAERGVPILDADQAARELTEKGQPALDRIREAFGMQVFNPDGSLNRLQLKKLIFADAGKKQQLEAILHPMILAALAAKAERLDVPYCILSIPLLFESKLEPFVDRILVVDCPLELQIERVSRRDKLDLKVIRAIIDSQVSRDYRRKHADDLLDNSQADNPLAEQVKKLHNLYLSLSPCQHKLTCDQQNHL
ncbi:dephospho-CoA kinase [Candidatus Methylomicrobium oryzae]|jgi:dephospho-CoA kinase|uniref:dephospho-CoA kinase n=1 Tax=Candidatus Methylomicrobium oryzae TaxID=2802053 RepID=UPI0019223995|nr:dephospho-CoA kinase [Methylomicrobium sp. RS1]MBL1262843.1 dephospho-CoA kinase [Methylomicrobium sp. RS1]